MDQNVIIAIAVITGVAVMLLAKVWLHALVKFKMDESAILNLLKQGNGEPSCLSSHEISNTLNIEAGQVTKVCTKSQKISEHTGQHDSWCLK